MKPVKIKILKIEEDKILISYPNLAQIGYHEIMTVSKIIEEKIKDKRIKLLTILGNEVEFTIEGKIQLFLDNKKRKNFIMAEAIVIRNAQQLFLENFYKSLVKKYYLIEIFKTIEDAKNWLNNIQCNKIKIEAS